MQVGWRRTWWSVCLFVREQGIHRDKNTVIIMEVDVVRGDNSSPALPKTCEAEEAEASISCRAVKVSRG